MSGVRSEFPRMCIEPINPQIAKLSRNLRTCWYIFGVSNSKKKGYILGFGTKTNILTPLSLYFLSPPWDDRLLRTWGTQVEPCNINNVQIG